MNIKILYAINYSGRTNCREMTFNSIYMYPLQGGNILILFHKHDWAVPISSHHGIYIKTKYC